MRELKIARQPIRQPKEPTFIPTATFLIKNELMLERLVKVGENHSEKTIQKKLVSFHACFKFRT